MFHESIQARIEAFVPEARLLLACARTEMDAQTAAQVRTLLVGEIDWEYVIRKAEEHFITPLLYNAIINICPYAVPKEILARLRDRFHWQALRNLFMSGELLRVLSLLRENGINAIPYKGATLAATAYKNIALRSFIDLDILVSEREVIKAKELLMSAGYQPRTQLTEAQEAAHIKSRGQKDIVLMRSDGSVSVELHWGVASLFLFPLDAGLLWDRLVEVNLGGMHIPNLGPEDTLLVLCVHGAKHSFRRVEWIADIAEVVRSNPEIDWDHVVTLAISLRSKRMLFLGLYLASRLLGAALPPFVAHRISEDAHVESLASRVLASLFREPSGVLNVFETVVFRGSLRDRWIDRARLRVHSYLYKLHLAWTPNDLDKLFLRLPNGLSFLYYLTRPVRLFGVYGVGNLLERLRFSKRR